MIPHLFYSSEAVETSLPNITEIAPPNRTGWIRPLFIAVSQVSMQLWQKPPQEVGEVLGRNDAGWVKTGVVYAARKRVRMLCDAIGLKGQGWKLAHRVVMATWCLRYCKWMTAAAAWFLRWRWSGMFLFLPPSIRPTPFARRKPRWRVEDSEVTRGLSRAVMRTQTILDGWSLKFEYPLNRHCLWSKPIAQIIQ